MMAGSMITILGPTASGKTTVAAKLAALIDGEVISADSRQVYRGMDLGTGKDYDDYTVDGIRIPYYLVDIRDAGYEYSIFEFRRDFLNAYKDILTREKRPVLCGGSGMYLETVLGGYAMADVPNNAMLRQSLASMSDEALIAHLSSLKKLHSTTDTSDRERMYRAIEIEEFHHAHPEKVKRQPGIESTIFGIGRNRNVLRERITKRLQQRLDNGMIDEVRTLLNSGLAPARLKTYGLEYKYLTMFVNGEIEFDEMFRLLNTAIHQFAKRQMTWFRRMERNGYLIHWLDGSLPADELASQIISISGIK
ncbi:MAG: tRNA (adenosine(37)-N6)-dimethylallyltransferase MiaA [Bacteroidota bacterium]